MARVWMAMSGGVDSSVGAAVLLEQGHEVTGVTMQLWPSDESESGCCSVSAVRDAKRVCDKLDIPHYTLNFREQFEAEVVSPFADEYAAGRTPNPCVLCNDRLKFSDLLARVSAQDADFLATGHYARIERDPAGKQWLARGVDATKDQSYFLYRLTDAQLERVLFPVGEMRKEDVRAFAERLGLAVADKPDSQEICFAADGDHAAVVEARRPEALRAGAIVDEEGDVLGTHEGIARYTIGQRRGLGIGGVAEPLYVVRIEAAENRVVVGPVESLRVSEVEAASVVWRGPHEARVTAAVRYRMTPVPAIARFAHGRLTVTFDEAVSGVAPGQSVVCYDGDRVLGGGLTECAS
ncbi:MAG: tRNA 2-thiouridine(34) synthase MnmA [Coriobacteriales bacterium]|nr:tRNA 2-thiouridine(34) synthase MnmA [Coriobacteriales bacterium]